MLMVKKNLLLYIIGGIATAISVFLIVIMTMSLTGNLKLFRTEFEVTFKNYDDTVLFVDHVEKGHDAVYEGETPTRPYDIDNYYVFTGWDRPLNNVQESFTTRALYSILHNPDDDPDDPTIEGKDIVGGGGDGDYSTIDPLTNIQFCVTTPYKKNVYLRSYSYGTEYLPSQNKWTAPDNMYIFSPQATNPLFYASSQMMRVSDLMAESSYISLRYESNNIPVPIPQYATKLVPTSEMNYKNDRYVDRLNENYQEYSFVPTKFSNYAFNLLRQTPVSSSYAGDEIDYRNYVYDNYLNFDEYYFNNVVVFSDSNNISYKKDADLVLGITNALTTFGTVDPYYYPGPQSLGDPITNLLGYNIGRPETYANLATLLFRYNGVPARTVKGFIVCTKGVETAFAVNQANISYWTEFYVNGIGWLYIDPVPRYGNNDGDSPGGNGGGGGGGGGGLTNHVGGEDPSQIPDTPIFEINCSKDGVHHLREHSAVYYENNNWSTEGYTPFGPATLNPIYYTSDRLKCTGQSEEQMRLKFYFELEGYPTPSHEATYNSVYIDDNCLYASPLNLRYSTTYFQELSYDDANIIGSGQYANVPIDEISRYERFVYENYLSTPYYLNGALDEFLNEYDLRAGDDDLVNKIHDIFVKSGEYTYETLHEEAGLDIVESFFNHKKGVCAEYATVSTLLYRRLGIPARYTVGYYAYGLANKDVVVGARSAHAWVEVFVHNVGWVVVENTSPYANGEFPGGWGDVDEPDPENKTTLYFNIDDTEIIYSGKPVTEEQLNLRENSIKDLDEDHVLAGFQLSKEYVNVGTYNVTLILDVREKGTGRNVSNHYEAVVAGTLTILHREITITTGSAEKEYDGEPLICLDFECDNLAEDETLSLKTNGEITERGVALNSVDMDTVQIFNERGVPTKQNYKITYEYGTLRVY